MNHDEFVDWGGTEYCSEFDSTGHPLLDVRFVGKNTSYRVWRFPWVGTPHTLPRIATRNSGNSTIVWATWNGATEVASWRVLGGSIPNSLHSAGSRRKTGYETAITVPAQTYVAVQALDSQGNVLSTSQTVHT